MISGRTEIYAHLGFPTEHARTPETMNAAFVDFRIDAVSVPFEVAIEDLTTAVVGLAGWRNLRGFGVTMPHKEPMFHLVDEVTPEAERARSVNNVRRNPDGRLIGHNTDGLGFVQSLLAADHAVMGEDVLQVGTGGAGRAISWALADQAPARLTLHDIDAARVGALAAEIAQAYPDIEVNTGPPVVENRTLVVNSTPLGMTPGDPLPISLDGLAPNAVVADIVSVRGTTPLIAQARDRGNATHTGMQMLDAQTRLVLEFLGWLAPRTT